MSADHHKAKAAELRAQAAVVKDAHVREQLLLMANDWQEMADQAEAAERAHRPPEG